MSLEGDWATFQHLDEPKDYYKNGQLHGLMGSVLTPMTRTVYSVSRDNRFTVGMLRDLLIYRNGEPDRDLCLVTDQSSEFERLRTLLEQRYNFVCVIEENAFENAPIMFSFYFKEGRS